jgi:acyl-CoA thioesterase-1
MPLLLTLAMLFLAVLPVRAAPLSIVALGDSLTAGYGLAAGEDFATRLEAALVASGIDASVANAGVSGDTASAGAARVDWAVPDGAALVIVELGANDALRGIDPAVTRKALSDLLARLGARNLKALLVGMRAPPNMGEDYVRSFDAIYPISPRARSAALPLLPRRRCRRGKPEPADGMHPTAAGVEEIVRRILPVVIAALGKSTH